MNFPESVDYLVSLGNEVSAMKLGLENIRRLLVELGDPQTKYLKVQVAGTNGKGSVCAFLNSICVGAWIKTGMYTSPHLVSITERIQIDSHQIGDNDFARLATRTRQTSETLVGRGELQSVPTFFEQVTAIALLAFAEANVELAILETGLGGRLDATTAVNAEIAAITRIDLDHQQYLGETIEEIAAEKAAIIHEGSRVVIGEQKPEAMRVILERCREQGIEPVIASAIMEGGNPTGREGASVSPTLSLPPLGLAGRHQIENARIALTLADILRDDFPISDARIIAGLETARHPGRLEFSGRFLFDGAHNAGGARALREFLDEFIDRPITLIFGSMDDKDVIEIASIIFPTVDRLILTRPDNSRAMTSQELLKVVPRNGPAQKVLEADDVRSALELALDVSGPNDLILVTGSLYLVGEVKQLLAARAGI